MKNFLSYILILVALVGFVAPTQVRASYEPLGRCTLPNGTVMNWTQATCTNSGNKGTWVENTGTCVFSQGTVTYDQCYGWNQNGWTGSNRSSGADNKTGTCTILNWSDTSCHENGGGGTFTPSNPGTPGSAPTATIAPVDTSYHLLAPLPCQSCDTCCNSSGQLTTFDPTQANNLGAYLNLMIKIFIGICAVLAVVMIVMGGIEWMTSELPGNKEQGKERIKGAVFGLILALGAWTLINQINPDILKADLSSLQTASVTVGLTADQQIANFTGNGTCTPVTNSSSACTATSLAKWGFAGDPNGTNASSICNGESGGNASQVSGVDVGGSDGKTGFSFGLFQVNALAHAGEIKAPDGSYPCQGVWQVNPNDPKAVSNYSSNNTKTLGSCLQLDKTGKICVKYSNTVIDQSKYNTCKSFLTDPTNNIAYAANLLDQTSWKSWGADSSCHF